MGGYDANMADLVGAMCLLRNCREMVRSVQEEFGRLDILVNNVGIQFVSPVQDFPEDRSPPPLPIPQPTFM